MNVALWLRHRKQQQPTHQHACRCGARWICSKPDCDRETECPDCQRRAFEAFAVRHGWLEFQPELVENREDDYGDYRFGR